WRHLVRYRLERRSPRWICEIALVGLQCGNGRKAGGGDGLAVAFLLLVGDMVSDALGDFWELAGEDFGGGGGNQIAARAGVDAAHPEGVAQVVKTGAGGEVVAELEADSLVDFPGSPVASGHELLHVFELDGD